MNGTSSVKQTLLQKGEPTTLTIFPSCFEKPEIDQVK